MLLKILKNVFYAALVFTIYLGVAGISHISGWHSLTSAYAAVVRRPVAAVSVVRGTARRTARRTTRRTAARHQQYYHTLPANCVIRPIGAIRYHYCGNVYYKPVYQGSNVSYIIVTNP